MQIGPPKLLEAAAQVLTQETMMEIRAQQPINRFGWAILDRWATNSPEKLKALEIEDGVVWLLMKVLDQQALEMDILTSDEALAQQRTGLVPHEILAMHEVNTEL